MKSAQERREERRETKLAEVQAQVESGSLVVRKMTDDERERYPLREPDPTKRQPPRWR